MKEFAGMDNMWEGDEDKLIEAHENLREDMFLDEVFGNNSKVKNEEFLVNTAKKSNWIFNSA